MSECVLRLIPAPAVVSVPWIRDYQSPEEKPPGGMRFLLITWFVPFNDGTVVLISGLNPSPVIGLPLLSAKEATRIRVMFIASVQNKCEQIKGHFIKSAKNIKTKSSATWILNHIKTGCPSIFLIPFRELAIFRGRWYPLTLTASSFGSHPINFLAPAPPPHTIMSFEMQPSPVTGLRRRKEEVSRDR